MTRIVALAGGVGGARFLRGLRAAAPDAEVTVVVNNGDDMWFHGLRVCPDLDTVMYTLGGGIHEQQGWGRVDESSRVSDELAAYGMGGEWFTLGDLDLGTHVARTELLRSGLPLSVVTERLCARWQPGVRLLPMTDDRCETTVICEDGSADGLSMHFEEWWVRHRAMLPVRAFTATTDGPVSPAPGVLAAIAEADLILLPPSNPVVSIGRILTVPGVADALRAAAAPVVGVSPIIGGRPVRGMADACLTAIGVETSAAAVAAHYGAAAAGGLLDGWVLDTADAASVTAVAALGISAVVLPTLMSDVEAATRIAAATMELAASLAR